MRTAVGFATSFVRTVDPAATAPQKKSAVEVPSELPAGIAKAESRHDSFAQVIGSVHCDFVFGPVGPAVELRVLLAPAADVAEPRELRPGTRPSPSG